MWVCSFLFCSPPIDFLLFNFPLQPLPNRPVSLPFSRLSVSPIFCCIITRSYFTDFCTTSSITVGSSFSLLNKYVFFFFDNPKGRKLISFTGSQIRCIGKGITVNESVKLRMKHSHSNQNKHSKSEEALLPFTYRNLHSFFFPKLKKTRMSHDDTLLV